MSSDNIKPDEVQTVYEASDKDTDGFIANLWNGNFGLPMTYWAYGVLGGIIWGAVLAALRPDSPKYSFQPAPESSDVENFVYFLMAIYYLIVYVGIWKASNKFTGSKVWTVLAKFVVVLVTVPLGIRLLRMYFEG